MHVATGEGINNLPLGEKPEMNFRFRLRDLFFLTLYAACLCAWVRWNFPADPSRWRWYTLWRPYNPGVYGFVASSVVIFAAIGHWRGRPADRSWTWLAFGLLIALVNHADGLFDCFAVLGHWYKGMFRENAAENFVATTTLPIAVAAPVAYLLLHAPAKQIMWADRMIFTSVIVAFVDILLLNIGLAILNP